MAAFSVPWCPGREGGDPEPEAGTGSSLHRVLAVPTNHRSRGAPPPGTVGEALERAAALIERRGWCRGKFRDEHGRVCLDFALLAAGREHNEEARRYVEEELTARGLGGAGVVVWNDDHARDEEEVLDVLRHAARRSQARSASLQR